MSAPQPEEGHGRPSPADYRVFGLASIAGAELVGPILVGLWLDHLFGWSPWGLGVGAVIGFVGGIAHLLVVANRTNARKTGGGG